LRTAEAFYAFAYPHIAVSGGKALRSDGKVVEIGYRAGGLDKLLVAATWFARAHAASNPELSQKWFAAAKAIYDGPYSKEGLNDWWRDYSHGGWGKLGAYNLMRLAPTEPKFHHELQYYCSRFCEYGTTPAGLRMREKHAHEYGSLRHANNAATIALHYSQHVEQSPALEGNNWWKGGRTNEQLKEQYFTEAKRQVDYALGANPYGRSYLAGFGKEPFNNVHHRGAYGSWAGFNHFIPGKPELRTESRHVLYGALVAGPDNTDVFLSGKEQRPWIKAVNEKGIEEGIPHYKFPNRPAPIPRWSYKWDPKDVPVQDVMDSQFNEVALDYNAGITASFALLTAKGLSNGGAIPDAQFPPKEVRNLSNDLLTTDREFFVTAKQLTIDATGVEIEATVDNRSRWPAKVTDQLSFRYYFTLEPGTTAADVKVALSGDDKAKAAPAKLLRNNVAYVEVGWPGEKIHPAPTIRMREPLKSSLPRRNGMPLTIGRTTR
jgi:endoglucanase